MNDGILTEIRKLEHILATEENQLGFLQNLDFQQLAFLTQKINNAIFLEQSSVWQKLGKVAGFMPNILNAKIAEDVLGPQITASLTYHVSVKEARATAKYFSLPFLIQVLEHLIPERSGELINSFDLEFKRKVSRQLIKNKKYYLMGSFLEILEFSTLLKLAEEFVENEDLIRTASFCVNKSQVARILFTFSDAKIASLLKTAVEQNFFQEIFAIISQIDIENIERYITIFRQTDDGIRQKIADNLLNNADFKAEVILRRIFLA